jgi:hypothetical protein
VKVRGHRCLVPGCKVWVRYQRWCCFQHGALLGWRLAARIHSAWANRLEDADEYARARREVLERLGWTDKPKEASHAHADKTAG